MRTETLIILSVFLSFCGGAYSVKDHTNIPEIQNIKVDSTTSSDDLINEYDFLDETSKPNTSEFEVGIIINSSDDTTTPESTNEPETTISEIETTEPVITTTNEETTETETTLTEEETTTPEPVCEITNTSYTIHEKLTITWSLNDVNLCKSHTVDITLINESCVEKCEEPEECSCSNTTHNRNASARAYTFPNELVACSKYYHKIQLTSSTQEDAIQSDIYDSPIKYDKVKNINITDIEDSQDPGALNMVITWDYDYPQCNQSFEVNVLGQSTNVQRTANGVQPYKITIDNLPACEQLDITVYTNANYSVMKNYTMRPVIPSKISLNAFNLTENSERGLIELQFSAPKYGEKCVERYLARIENDYETKYEDVSSKVISNIYACVDYRVTLIYCTIIKGPNESSESTTTSTSTIAIHSQVTGSLLSVPTTLCRSDNVYNASDAKNITTAPKQFSQPQQPDFIDRSDTTLTLKVIPAEEIRNKCKISEYLIQCTSNEGGKEHLESSNNETVKVDDLLPFHNYSCSAGVKNENSEKSPWSSSRNFMTTEGVPNAPVFSYSDVDSTSFTITWETPTQPKGQIKQYYVYIMFSKFAYDNPTYCSSGPPNKTETITANNTMSSFTYKFTEAVPAARYFVQIQAENGVNRGEMSKSIIVTTLQGPSDEIMNFEIAPNIIEPNKPYNKLITLYFKYPCQANGNITGFSISFGSEFNGIVPYPDDSESDRYSFSFSTKDLNPDIKYNISVFAFTENYEHIGKSYTTTFELNPGIPVPNNEILKNINPETSTNAFYISIPEDLFKSDVGKIEFVTILLGGADCQDLEPLSNLRENINELHTYHDTIEQRCIPLYDTGIIITERKNESHKEGIGTELICESNRKCNGPLRPGTSYGLTFRLFTRTGFSDTDYKIIFTNKQVPIITISIIILSILCLVFLIGFYISCRRTKALRDSAVDSPYDRKDISVQNYHAYYVTMTKNDNEKIKEEYRAIQFFSDNLDKTFIASKANEKLNRYLNIYPYDANRVVLNDDEFENDYINASYINGYYYPKEYIAAQGPKPNTVGDFWRMIIQHKVESIVMLTSLVENNKVKCHEYFPKLNGHLRSNNINIQCIEEQKFTNYIKRILTVEKNDVKLKVSHYYFCKWPDHGCPNNSLDLIEFVKIVRNERHRPGETFVVHCSAGVGRTGTFIALDIMMQRIKKESRINIFDLVKQLRIQRMKMVQSPDQYIFLYTSALELITMPRDTNALKNLRDAVLKYVNEFEIPNNLKPKGKRKGESIAVKRTVEKETEM